MRRSLVALVVLLAFSRVADASFINYSAREINVKIVYWSSPTLKTAAEASLTYIYGKLEPASKGKLISLATETERTLFFDFLPPKLGEIRGFKTRLHLYTTPTAPEYGESRKLILKGVDGIVFIADADPKSAKANAESYAELKKTLAANGYAIDDVPLVFQVQNTTKKGAVEVEVLAKSLASGDRPAHAADPTTGIGMFDTVKSIAKLILLELKKGDPAPAGKPAAPPAAPDEPVKPPKTTPRAPQPTR
jgi:mutual gliding-motility protein MglA